MFRLLIVDDEAIIVDGLYEAFEAEKNLPLDLFKAYSGEMALERLHKTRIDIVLTDINMPGINGFELLEAIRARWPDCKVIFLTAHDHFEYAYQAIQYPGVSYLLKNEDYEKIIETVNQAIQDLQQRIQTEKLLQDARVQLAKADELVQRTRLLRLLEGTIPPATIHTLTIPLALDAPVLLALGQCTHSHEESAAFDERTTHQAIFLIMKQYLSSGMDVWISQGEQGQFILLAQPHPQLPPGGLKPVTFLQGMLELVQNTCRESLETSISFVLSSNLCPWSELPHEFKALSDLLRLHGGLKMETLMVRDQANPPIPSTEHDMALSDFLRTGMLNRLPMLLDSGQWEQIYSVIDQLASALQPIQSLHHNIAVEGYMRCALSMLHHINQRGLSEKLSFRIAQYKLMRFDVHGTWEEAIAYLRNMADALSACQQDDQQDRMKVTIQAIQAYIEAHLGDDLSLVVLADHVSLNPSYLSRLYKQGTGENVTDTIETMRISQAKVWLAQEEWRIHEVGRRVGYETAGSFTRFFRKRTGMTPQEYRETFRYVK